MNTHIRKIAKFSRENKKIGQGMVEFALILPIILMSLFVIIELARVLHSWLAIENGARTAVRFAVTGEYNPANCDGGFLGLDCTFLSDEPEARVESIHEAAWAGSTSIIRVAEFEVTSIDPSFFKVTICDPITMVGPLSTFGETSCPGGEDPGGPGDRVTVVVEFNHPLFLPGLSSIWPQLRLTAMREATVETFRVLQSAGSPPTVLPPPIPITSTPPPTNTPAPIPGPECSKLSFVQWKWKSTNRYFVLLRDTNPEEGDITYFWTEYPDLGGGDLDKVSYHKIANPLSTKESITTGDHMGTAFETSVPGGAKFWVSPGGAKSRISVNFDALPGGQLPFGTYKVTVEVTYPGFIDEFGDPKKCKANITGNRTSTTPSSTPSTPGATSVPTDADLPTPTPPGPVDTPVNTLVPPPD